MEFLMRCRPNPLTAPRGHKVFLHALKTALRFEKFLPLTQLSLFAGFRNHILNRGILMAQPKLPSNFVLFQLSTTLSRGFR